MSVQQRRSRKDWFVTSIAHHLVLELRRSTSSTPASNPLINGYEARSAFLPDATLDSSCVVSVDAVARLRWIGSIASRDGDVQLRRRLA
jgi:uncharacterized protein